MAQQASLGGCLQPDQHSTSASKLVVSCADLLPLAQHNSICACLRSTSTVRQRPSDACFPREQGEALVPDINQQHSAAPSCVLATSDSTMSKPTQPPLWEMPTFKTLKQLHAHGPPQLDLGCYC